MSNTDLPAKFANPKLTLFAFHLRNNLAQGLEETVENANLLWEQCQNLGQKLGVNRLETLISKLKKDNNNKIGIFPGNENPVSNYLELLTSEKFIDFSATPNSSSLKIRGEVYPLQIHDTFAVDITLRYPYFSVEIAQLSHLNPESYLSPNQIIQASLGKTFLLFAQPLEKVEDLQKLANACIITLFPTIKPEKLLHYPPSSGYFLGSAIFEYDIREENSSKNLHVLVWLNCDAKTEELETEGSYYQPLINLLCCRSKIIYTYTQSRWCNNQARRLYKQLEEKVAAFKTLPSTRVERLTELKRWLAEIPELTLEYSRYLRDLEVHIKTIETNIKNYELFLNTLHNISIKDKDNLEFFQQFLKYSEETLTEQIKVDLGYLNVGKQLFEQMIGTIRGIVEIEQAESDRNLQKTIQAVGFSIGAAGIVATSAPYWIKQNPREILINKPFTSHSLNTFTLVLVLSFFTGLATWVIISVIINSKNWIAGVKYWFSSKVGNKKNQASLPSSANQPVQITSGQKEPEQTSISQNN
ncbi:hypothetical protein [Floridanema evergladense]|uniref:Uncharacterized protein n=1 Tax=Floridaenema evergladense BLCC-F167 TaxID=3153639 RepID=A0ABV4WGN8_9CYAN